MLFICRKSVDYKMYQFIFFKIRILVDRVYKNYLSSMFNLNNNILSSHTCQCELFVVRLDIMWVVVGKIL